MRLKGERHRIVLRFSGPDARDIAGRLARSLPDREFAIRGLLVADLVVTDADCGQDGAKLTLEALTFEEAFSPAPIPD